MAKVENKQMFQSYIFTTAKYDFSVYEKRILYRQIEIEQALLNDEALRDCIKIDTNLWGDRKYTIPISMLLNGDEDKNHYQIKKAFESLRIKRIEYEDDEIYSCFGVVSSYEIKKRDKFISWVSHSKIVEAVMDFSKGWRKYELKIAMQFESIYAMRFYELIAGKRNHITYEVAFLEKMFMLENKYRNPQGKLNISMFVRRVLEPAKKELDKCSPYTFDYYLSKDKKMITIIPVFQEQYADEKMKKDHLEQEKRDLYSVLGEREIEVFISEFGFTEQGLRNNYLLFQECKKELPENYSFFLFQEIRKSLKRKKKIDPAYVIGIIKNMLEDYKKEKNKD